MGLLAAIMTAGALPAAGQSATVRGFVRDAADGQPLPGVHVVLSRADREPSGAATDADGHYSVARVPAGRYAVRASFIGYRTHLDTLDLEPGRLRTYNIELAREATGLDEVIVETERETAGAAGISAGLQSVRAGDIELIPAPDVSADLANYLTTMPGVVASGDQGGQLFIRGGEPTQNLVLLDGIPVYQPFHLVGFYSAFPADIVQNADVYAGGYGPRHGGFLSSVIDVATRHGNKRRFAASVSAAPFVSGARLEGPLWTGRVSMLGSYRRSMIEQGAARLIDRELPYRFDDAFAKVHAILSANSQLSATVLQTHDRGVLRRSVGGRADDEVTWRNEGYGLRYLLLPASMPVLAELVLAGTRVENRFGPEGAPTRRSRAFQVGTTLNMTHFLGRADVHWGLFLRTSALSSDLGGLFQDLSTEDEYVTEAGAHLAPELRLPAGLTLQPGLRVHAFPSKGRSYAEPRVRAVWHGGIHRLSAAWGVYHQQMVGLNDRRDAGDVFTAWTATPPGEVPEATHFLAGYQVQPGGGLTLAAEGFAKRLRHLSVAEWTAFPRFTTRLQPADGRVRGFDLRAELRRGRFYGFVNYGYGVVTYDAHPPALRFDATAQTYHPPHDRRHQINAVAGVAAAGFDVSLRWQLGTGLPFSQAFGFDVFEFLDGPHDVAADPGQVRVLYGEPYRARLPDFHRLDVAVERRFPVGARAALTVQGSLVNAYDRANLFYIDLFTLERMNQLPLIPSVGLRLDVF